MNNNQDNSEEMNLYIAHVGFYDQDIGMYELHSNIFVVAPSITAAKQAVKCKEIFINKKMHIDGIQEVSFVDGYKISAAQYNLLAHENKAYSYDEVKKLTE